MQMHAYGHFVWGCVHCVGTKEQLLGSTSEDALNLTNLRDDPGSCIEGLMDFFGGSSGLIEGSWVVLVTSIPLAYVGDLHMI